jgi:hypothetical protein
MYIGSNYNWYIIELLWEGILLGVTLFLYNKYKIDGLIVWIVTNLIVTIWIYYSYMSAFKYKVYKIPRDNIYHLHLFIPSNEY